MAKDVTFIIDKPPCGDLLEKLADFLVTRAAKQAGLKVGGTVRERTPGDPERPVRDCLSALMTGEAS